MKLAVMACLTIFLTFDLSAQECDCEETCSCTLKGKILDAETGEPLALAFISIKNQKRNTTTNEKGEFVISGICQCTFDLQVNYIGYFSKTLKVDLSKKRDIAIALEPDLLMLEEVSISDHFLGSEIVSLTTDNLTVNEVQSSKGENLATMLTRISGVNTLNTGSRVSKPIIHGLHSDRLLILNNGIRHESQSWGQDHAPEIDPFLAKGLSVVKGAATVRYGSGALGGVVLVTPGEL
jgi:iron complex outermembrane receptor protein